MALYKVVMRQILFDVGWYEANSKEEALAMAEADETLEPDEIEDNTFEAELVNENEIEN